MVLDRIDGVFDERRLIADDLRLDILRQALPGSTLSRSFTSFAVVTVFSPDCLETTSVTAGTPSSRAAVTGSS